MNNILHGHCKQEWLWLSLSEFRLVGQRHKCATDMDNVINARKGIWTEYYGTQLTVFILHFYGLLPHLYGLQPCYSKWSQLSRSFSFTWKLIKNCRTLRSFSIPDMSHNFHFTMDPSYVYTIKVWEPLIYKTWMPNNLDESYMILLVSFYV